MICENENLLGFGEGSDPSVNDQQYLYKRRVRVGLIWGGFKPDSFIK